MLSVERDRSIVTLRKLVRDVSVGKKLSNGDKGRDKLKISEAFYLLKVSQQLVG